MAVPAELLVRIQDATRLKPYRSAVVRRETCSVRSSSPVPDRASANVNVSNVNAELVSITGYHRRVVRRGLATLLLLATGACSGGSPTSPTPSPTPPGASMPSDTLQAAASARGKLVGAAIQTSFLGDRQYGTVLGREFNYLTAEYEMKWNIVEPGRGSMNFGLGDAIVGYAASNGMRVKGHTLIWHGAVPSWLDGLPTGELRTEFERHIRDVMAHYRGRVHAGTSSMKRSPTTARPSATRFFARGSAMNTSPTPFAWRAPSTHRRSSSTTTMAARA
jgi:Glycosyl hydrolase family 10